MWIQKTLGKKTKSNCVFPLMKIEWIKLILSMPIPNFSIQAHQTHFHKETGRRNRVQNRKAPLFPAATLSLWALKHTKCWQKYPICHSFNKKLKCLCTLWHNKQLLVLNMKLFRLHSKRVDTCYSWVIRKK